MAAKRALSRVPTQPLLKVAKVGTRTKSVLPRNKSLGDPKNIYPTKLMYHNGAYNQGIAAGAGYKISQLINDISSNGLQPMGRDQLFALFDKAYVKSVNARINMGFNTSSAQVVLAVWFDTVTTQTTSAPTAVERAMSHKGTVKYFNGGSNLNSTMHTVQATGYTKQLTGLGFKEGETICYEGTSPASDGQMYLHVEVWNIGTTNLDANGSGLQINWDFVYDTIFYDPKELAVS